MQEETDETTDMQADEFNGSPRWGAGRFSSPVQRWLFLLAIMTVLTIAHFSTSAHHSWAHDFLFKVTYLPIVLAALWFGWRGGFLLSLLTGGIYIIHIRWQLAGHGNHSQVSMILELVLYLVIGLVVGWLSDQQRGIQERLAGTNVRLKNSISSLREKTEALLAAEETLRRADRLKAAGEIATGLAHEVRNPLGGIVGAAEILSDPETDAAARSEFASVIYREAKRLDRVISQFLDFARPGDSGSGTSNLAQEIEFVGTLTAGPRGKKTTTFGQSEVPADLTVGIATDPLRQILLNLTLNSLAAVPQESGRIAWRAERQGKIVRLRISDNGPGISDVVRDRIFEPFVTTRNSTGLGLAIVARLMRDVGGTVTLEESGHTGTVFCLDFPVVDDRIKTIHPEGA